MERQEGRDHQPESCRNVAHRLFRIGDEYRIPGDHRGGKQPGLARRTSRVRADTEQQGHRAITGATKSTARRRQSAEDAITGTRRSETSARSPLRLADGPAQRRCDRHSIRCRQPFRDRRRIDPGRSRSVAGADIAVRIRSANRCQEKTQPSVDAAADRGQQHDALSHAGSGAMPCSASSMGGPREGTLVATARTRIGDYEIEES